MRRGRADGGSCWSADPTCRVRPLKQRMALKRSARGLGRCITTSPTKSDAAHGGRLHQSTGPQAHCQGGRIQAERRQAWCLRRRRRRSRIQSQKRNKALKQLMLQAGHGQNRLLVDASNVVVKMFSVIHKGGPRDQAVSGGATHLKIRGQLRLCAEHSVETIHSATEGESAATLSGIHDVATINSSNRDRRKHSQKDNQQRSTLPRTARRSNSVST